jgi:protein-tyrosine phosphatase
MYKAKERIIDRLTSWGKKVPFIEGVYHVVSTTSDLADPAAELVFLLVMDPGHAATSVLEALKILFSEDLIMALLVPDGITCNTVSLYFKTLPRIEVKITMPGDDATMLIQESGNVVPLVERPGHGSGKGVESSQHEKNTNNSIKAIIKHRVSCILRGFELAAIAHYHSDYIGFYAVHYPLLLDTLHVQGILAGKIMPVGSAKHLLNAVMTEPEQQYFTKNLLEASFSEANTIRQFFMDWFFSLVEDIQEKLGLDALPAPANVITRLCEHVHETYYLRNFRPVQGTKRVFRALAPAVYKDDPRLEKWFVANNLKTLIDLRRPDEVEKAPDDPVLAKKLGQTIHLLNFNADEVSASDYIKGLIGCKVEVRQMFEAMLASPGSTLIHCGAGKDRTGMISALVELLLGIPEDKVIAAYLLSGQDTREERIVQTLGYIREHGGVGAYLESCGFAATSQARLVEKLAPR